MNPERGRKHVYLSAIGGDYDGFQNMNPERGRKQKEVYCYRISVVFISEHEPRKGTETLPLL